MFLKDSWVSTLKVAMRSSLRDMSKGWYNLYEASWEVYLTSKLRRLMELIKYMLQDSLRFLVQDSLSSFAQCISEACCSVLHCPRDMAWGEDRINSSYRWGPAGRGSWCPTAVPCQAPGGCSCWGGDQGSLSESPAPTPAARCHLTGSDLSFSWGPLFSQSVTSHSTGKDSLSTCPEPCGFQGSRAAGGCSHGGTRAGEQSSAVLAGTVPGRGGI